MKVAATAEADSKEDYAGKRTTYFQQNIPKCPFHGECTLAKHVTRRHADSWDDFPKFPYIGVYNVLRETMAG